MNENEAQEQVELSDDELLKAVADMWDEVDEDDDYIEDGYEGNDDSDQPVDDSEPEQDEDGNPEPDHDDEQPEEKPEESEEPGAETETANQRFKIKYNGAEEEYDLDQMTTLAQKGRNYDHVVEERDSLRGKAKDAETQLAFLKDLADRAGLTVEEQIDRTRALWLMNDEFDKGNEISEADALLRVQRDKKKAAETEEKAEQPKQNDADREVARFMAVYPGVKYEDIPQEVWNVANQTGDLVMAYTLNEINKLKGENEKLKKDAQNERNAQRSTGPLKTSGTKKKRSVIDDAWYSDD